MKVDFAKLDRAFNPKCLVVVGDNAGRNFSWLRAQSAFQGRLYSVQINPESAKAIQALGVANYASLLDIPEPVDLVIVAVPRAVAPRILEDCIRKEVAAVHFFTSGFNETDTEEGMELMGVLAERAKQANLNLIGPNCMGIFNPRLGVKQRAEQYSGSAGSVGFIAQSGLIAIIFSYEAHAQGVDISKSVSFGNGIVLDAADYLEYFAGDPEIKVIGMYLEGVKDGRRFLSVLRKVAAQKPVVVWKGGRSEGGGRAIASHTGSLAVPQAVWDAAVRQGGAIKVSRMEEMIDTLKALLYLPPVKGDRVGIAGGSGGQSAVVADAFAEAGLRVPLLTRASYDRLATFFSRVGAGYRNPIDPGSNRRELKRIMEILEQDANIDNLVLFLTAHFGPPEQQSHQIEMMADIRQRTAKPLVVIAGFATPEEMQRAASLTQQFQDKGVPSFPSAERGAFALRILLDYYSSRRNIGA